MLEIDLHSHTTFSACGTHTVMEMLARARDNGVKAYAITDHSPNTGGRIPSTFFDRLVEPLKGIQLLKGMEASISGDNGNIDIVDRYIPFMDVILAGIHPDVERGLTPEYSTEKMIEAMAANPIIDIISHPADPVYPVNIMEVAASAQKKGIALELNNSKLLWHRTTSELTFDFLKACMATGCLIAVNSDAHTVNEVGRDTEAKTYLTDCDFPSDQIVNLTKERGLAWLESPKERKQWG